MAYALGFFSRPTVFSAVAGVSATILIVLTVKSVECWFCGYHLEVPRTLANSFTCPSCDQYNGFDSDGGYNIRIPAQYDASLNSRSYQIHKQFSSQSNVFCDRCAVNQAILIKKIASFEPKNEKQWQSELRNYTRKLECIYSLCRECQEKATSRILQVISLFSFRTLYVFDLNSLIIHQHLFNCFMTGHLSTIWLLGLEYLHIIFEH
ncbi:unnamed protein product [Echinostoma caproni]|uniref:Ima1_N domain-containing protein n=1 Tax=Echinostoma caproni TaxID=27848 RepID=A0A183APQ3_9TREM|nr:unnamed protein product [Echinostoma caproni]